MRILLSGVILFLSACGSLPVSTDYQADYDFSSINSYVFTVPAPQASAAKNIELQSDLNHQRTLDAIEADLQARGWEKLDTPRSDSVLVTYHRGIEDKHEHLSTFDAGWPYCYGCYRHPGWRSYYGFHADFHDDLVRTEDSLVIDFVAPDSNTLIWRGSHSRRMPSLSSPQEREMYIRESVTAILPQERKSVGVGKDVWVQL